MFDWLILVLFSGRNNKHDNNDFQQILINFKKFGPDDIISHRL